jgi:hypothetical protein
LVDTPVSVARFVTELEHWVGRPMHITAAIYMNDLESALIEDISKWLEELAPARPDYKHHETGEDNGDTHLRALLHHETTMPALLTRMSRRPKSARFLFLAPVEQTAQAPFTVVLNWQAGLKK